VENITPVVGQENPASIRLTGKGVYKGKTYYLGNRTKDGQRVRCLTLPNAAGEYLDFWANVSEVEVTKEYQPREVRVGFRGRTETRYTTLGSIADFIAKQRDAAQRGEQPCAACGKRGPLHHDLEDGLMKCLACCDIPE